MEGCLAVLFLRLSVRALPRLLTCVFHSVSGVLAFLDSRKCGLCIGSLVGRGGGSLSGDGMRSSVAG